MTEVKIRRGSWKDAPFQAVDASRLSVIGFVDKAWTRNRYPMPLLTLDRKQDLTYFEESGTVRVQGLTPSYRVDDGTEFLPGQFDGQVDIKGIRPFGFGEVYLGSATYPSSVDGYILEGQAPFDPAKELAFVRELDPRFVIASIASYPPEKRYLAYAPPHVLGDLGKLAISD